MKRALWLCLLLCAACEQPAPKAAKVPPKAAVSRYLRESFPVGDGNGEGDAAATCRVNQAMLSLAESDELPYPGARVLPDVRMLDLSLRCADAHGAERSPRDVLPQDTVFLLLHEGDSWAPRPRAASDPEGQLRFELPDRGASVLPSPRRYDADSGALVVPYERSPARLKLTSRDLNVEVTLRERAQNAALDAFLQRLVTGLTAGADLTALSLAPDGAEAVAQLSSTFRAVRERFHPARIELAGLSAGAHRELLLELRLLRPRAHAHSFEVARFRLVVAPASDGSVRVKRFDNREAARARLACGGLEEALRQAVLETPRAPHGETCNVLGVLLPQHCADLARALVGRALEVGARCRTADDVRPSEGKVPADFQLTLKRGRSARGLDQDPRYVVVLFHTGQVVFHGRHWVRSRERSDGRTDPALLAGLYAHVRKLDWFARRGGTYDADGCSPSAPLGDVITVRAESRERMVVHRDGCRGPFSEAELTRLRKHVEQVAAISAWTEPEPAYLDDEAEQWAVASDED